MLIEKSDLVVNVENKNMDCVNCGESANWVCHGCNDTFYCSIKCQEKDWIFTHHNTCDSVEEFEKKEKKKKKRLKKPTLENPSSIKENTKIYEGRYTLIENIGEGSYGSVFKALDGKTPVVIKFQKLGVRADKDDIISFMIETLNLSIAKKDNKICKSLACGELAFLEFIGKQLYGIIVFPFQAENTLDQMLTAFSKMDITKLNTNEKNDIKETKDTVFLKLMEAVNKIHKNTFIPMAHMDLKPTNVIISTDPQNEDKVNEVIVIDLGLSCVRNIDKKREIDQIMTTTFADVMENTKSKAALAWIENNLNSVIMDIKQSLVCTSGQGTLQFKRDDDILVTGKEFEYGIRQDIYALGVIFFMLYSNLDENELLELYEGKNMKEIIKSVQKSFPTAVWDFLHRSLFLKDVDSKSFKPFKNVNEMIEIFKKTL